MAYSCGFAIRRQITATSFSTARSGNAERGVTELARAPVNNGRAYPDAEAVLINAKLEGISPVGWGAMGGDAANMHYWEYNSVNLSDGKPVDGEPAQSGIKQLTVEKDAETIANYSNPAYVWAGLRRCPR